MNTNKHKNPIKGMAALKERQNINTKINEQDQAYLKINAENLRIAHEWLSEQRRKMALEIGGDLSPERRAT